MSAQLPIGIFDSGVGGLTVARAIIDQLPDEEIVYVGDTANGPYGPLTVPQIREHALAIGDDLAERGIKALVIACNTASSACLRDARERYAPIPVVEVILPAVRRAVAATRNGRIGVIGTAATIASGAYQDSFAAARDIEVFGVACPRFVDFVERGVTSGRQVLGLAEGYLEPLQRAEVDTLVLGCTHYPMLSGLIQLAMGDHVTLVSSAEETAKEEGKPEAALPKIVEGRVNGFFKENVLLDQPFAKDSKKSVGKVLEEAGASATQFARFRVGS